jgi:Ca2+-binding RTX toxin-like protein
MTINGTVGNDTITPSGPPSPGVTGWYFGLNNNDSILGFAGNDLIDGGIGNDTLDGGIGNDTLYGDAGDDILYGSGGDDILKSGKGEALPFLEARIASVMNAKTLRF